ncbi:MAG: sodium-dependent bicarbonate transport family permease [Trueperaceae bacterium]|nr:sodium-dependent bicarbonate transport family permease [Trueperaceae bacterium]
MDALELVRLNLLSPMILAFALGIVATLIRSDLRLPDALYSALSIYLLLAIGLKGGVALRATPIAEIAGPALVTLLAGALIPLTTYPIARRLGGWSVADSAALAAHYGSVSVVTFVAAQAFLDRAGVPYEGFIATLLALLEVPAILVALLIARRAQTTQEEATPWTETLREVLTGKSIVLIVGGLAMGAAAGAAGVERVEPFFVDPFEGALTLFLLEMGLVTARRFGEVRSAGPFLLAYGTIAPLVHGTIGVAAGLASGLSPGGATLFATLLASASYIAATAAVRLALPEASPGRYLTASLAITFPFNLVIGIPTYARLAQAWGGGGG